MKSKYFFTIAMLSALVLFLYSPVSKAQIDGHNYTIQWETSPGSGIVMKNALYNTVMGDTNTDGSRRDPDVVYRLLKGGVYWNTEHIQNNGWALRLVGETPDPADEFGFPALIQIVLRDDQSADSHILLGYGDVYMKNVYIIGADDRGVQASYYQPMEFESNNARCVFDSVIFERSNFAITAWQGAKNDEIIFTNCKWYNLVERPITQQWTGRGVSIWADQDSVIIENCTFDNVGFTVLQIEGGAANYVRFNHNTIINLGRSITSAPWLREAYFANNLIVNPFFDGEGYVDYNPVGNPSRYNYVTGFFNFSTLPATYGTDAGRRIVFANSAAYLAQTFKSAWDDTVRIQPYTNATTDSFFTFYDASTNPEGQMKIQDTLWLSTFPNFGKYDTTNYDNMVNFIKDIRAGITPAPQWMQDLYIQGSDTIWTSPQWPIIQDFSYTDAGLMTAGTDGLPLGDLNWFPDQHSQFESNKDQYINGIKNLGGQQHVQVIADEGEAEGGTLGGDASAQNVQGFVYYRFETAGDILWNFNLASAVPNCKLVVYTNLTNQNPRGENIYVNGTNLQNNSGFGEYHFTSPPLAITGWDSVIIIKDSLISGADALDLPAGANTLEIKKSWGYQNFSGANIYDASGNLVKSVRIPEATYSGGILTVEGAVWTPSGLRYVNMGTAGTVSLDLTAPNATNYFVNLFYQNTGSDQTVQVSDGSTPLTSLTLTANIDSSRQSKSSNRFSLSAGTHSLTFSGAGFNLDFVQLIKDSVVSGIIDRGIQPISYALSQNYPNPFNPSTKINFSIAKPSIVKLIVYDILGRKVATLINNQMNTGSYIYTFNAGRFASGVYFYSIEAGDFRVTKKMMLLK
ncbi:MAG TPA: T9SS type A sorting domain-containing protein [Ignavibacteriaceae bacterium]|nr:T9SS type A sorting domain-containing protein [Ignavibacteriaceae bacterium]